MSAAAFLLYLAVPNIVPTIRAARADGIPGVFTARQLTCVRHGSHESCTWTGEFMSDDGAVHRRRVSLHGSVRETFNHGETTRAIDVGRPSRVYGPDGSREWMFTALMLLSGIAVLVYTALRPLRNRLKTRAWQGQGETPVVIADREDVT